MAWPVSPPHLETTLQDIPDAPGVYLLYGETPQPLYVGKSEHLRGRVLSHFQADHTSARDMQLAQETRRVEYQSTAGELGALLLESRLVKQLQPAFNRKLRRAAPLCFWQLADDADARPQVRLVEMDDLAAGRTDIHVFDHWCHLVTVHDESELHDALQSRAMLAFDNDTCKLLAKRVFSAGGKVVPGLIRFDHRKVAGAPAA